MPDDSTILSLPLILPAQAQKHVTHNEALRLLDVMVQLAVQDRSLATPPLSPAEGERHIAAVGASGAWAGHDGEIALFAQGGWSFFAPLPGWRAWIAAEEAIATFDGTQWATSADSPLSVAQLGISTTADATNRLTVASAATLLTNAGAGHQLKVNKAAQTDTASLLFQSGFSGRAEMGVAGTDDFSVKVSADGALWSDAITAAAASGIVSLPQGVSTAGFALRDATDPAKKALFSTANLTSGSPRTYTLPNVSSELAAISGTQTFTGVKSFSGTFSVSAASAQLGTSTASASYGVGAGATASGNSKTVNIGTDGLSGSTTVLNLGSSIAGAAGAMVINSPSVSFANSVASVAMPEANLSAKYLGLGGASADTNNRLSVNSALVLFNNAGNSIETVLNKSTSTDDASLTFKTGFSPRALVGLLGNDDWSVKVSETGAIYTTALSVAANSGAMTLAKPLILGGQSADPVAPPEGTVWHNATTGQLKAQLGGKSRPLDRQETCNFVVPPVGEYIQTTTGCGASTSTLAGAANRIDLFPFIPGRDFDFDRLAVNVTTAVASALAKIVIYSTDEMGRPDALLLETGTLDLSATGSRTVDATFSLRQGRCYWFGLRHSSTATVSIWQAYATPDINGGTAPSVGGRKVLRRLVTFGSAAPATWGFVSAEITSTNASAIWLRRV